MVDLVCPLMYRAQVPFVGGPRGHRYILEGKPRRPPQVRWPMANLSERGATGETGVILLDRAGVVRRCSGTAAELLGYTVAEVCGRPITTLLEDPSQPTRSVAAGALPFTSHGTTLFRHGSRGPVELTVAQVPLDGSSEVALIVTPASEAGMWEQSSAFLHALLTQEQLGIVLFDTGLTVARTNGTPGMDGWPHLHAGDHLADVISTEDANEAETRLRRVLETGVAQVSGEQRMRARDASKQERSFSVSAFRLEDGHARPTGVAALFIDNTEQWRARRRTEVSHQASDRIGASLDVTRTAQDMASVLVPALGDMATVEIVDSVLEGDETPKGLLPGGPRSLRRVAVASSVGPWPAELIPVGGVIPNLPDTAHVHRAALHGDTVFSATRQEMADLLDDPELIRSMLPAKGHSAVVAPLFARGHFLGVVGVWRTERPEPFQQEDTDLLFDIAARAALSLDNARRYTREHRAAVALQQRLLPRAVTRTTVAESAGHYIPAGGGADISGDWFDVIPLPSLRVAFVVGDVIGHGLHAAATMGRLRTAIHTLADLEFAPGELLSHLDDLVQQLADEAAPHLKDTIGATCLYALYDPVTGTCSLASAGHPPPAEIRPDGAGRLITVSPGPPLGVGGMPFEETTVDLEPGGTLALYTDGLVHARFDDADQGIRELLDSLSSLCRHDETLTDIGHAVVAELTETPSRDDMALLLARTRRIPASAIADWTFPDDPAAVADARRAVARQLAAWELDHMAFTTELIVSELVTNAIRYARGTVGLRLFHDDATLVCEVTDSSNTQPRLRRARAGDEGGRGLFLVAQLSKRWGSRYHQTGKTIWVEESTTALSAQETALAAVWDSATL
ncbi:SpoIIE family protein phosphatase [Streptomyces pseudovenezuelae]|uniref:PAS domain S-box-containing protein n=1 Tax=Streptomyces pseudovenezuelae TaxID=67350 RepID=A0ABT6LV43_9ACTN|nr:SpoIIE family protein phosphatase [Streptomyces pseudovenezuelae]MDH6219566.1 PAS domain S-box-containing protein [Streptomyces pseudovenezuelae]